MSQCGSVSDYSPCFSFFFFGFDENSVNNCIIHRSEDTGTCYVYLNLCHGVIKDEHQLCTLMHLWNCY